MVSKVLNFNGNGQTPAFSSGYIDWKKDKVYVKRLLAGAKFLRELKLPKKAKFDFNTIGYHVGDHKPTEKNYCGTSACAMGWFGVYKFGDFRSKWEPEYEEDKVKEFNLVVYHKDYDSVYDFKAAAEYFGINLEVSHWLFNPDDYPIMKVTKENVAERMEWVANYGISPAS